MSDETTPIVPEETVVPTSPIGTDMPETVVTPTTEEEVKPVVETPAPETPSVQ